MPKTTLTREQAVEARSLYKKHVPQWKIAERYGVTRGCISELIRGKTWGFKSISRGKARGEDNHAKLSETDVQAVRLLHAWGFTPAYIAGRFGIGKAYVHRLVARQKWAHLASPAKS